MLTQTVRRLVTNLGHGITQWVDPAQPKIFVDTVHEYSAKYLG